MKREAVGDVARKSAKHGMAWAWHVRGEARPAVIIHHHILAFGE
jgi:hypothetical protein